MRVNYSVPGLSLLHLLLFLLGRRGETWAGWSLYWAASAFVILFYLLARDLFPSGRRDRLPDLRSALAWGAAGALEFQTLYPALADTRLVPAILFPSIAWLLSAWPSAIYGVAALSWLLFSPDGLLPEAGRMVSVGGIAAFGLCAGRLARWKLGGRPEGRELVQEAIDESRSLVLPWEGLHAGKEETRSGGAVERLGLLRSREELMEGVRRILEGVLPVTGADVVLFVSPSTEPGRPYRVSASASRGGDTGKGEFSIPDHYVPVREAMLFRRPFFAEGEGAGAWAIGGGKKEDPTGVASAPVAIEGGVEGAVLAMRYAEARWAEPVGHVLEMAAFFVARELARAKRQYQANRYLARQEGLHRLVRKIAEIAEKGGGEGVSPRKEVFRASTEQVRRQLDADRSILVETTEGEDKGRIAWESAETVSRDQEEWINLEGTYLEWVLKQGVHRIFTGAQAESARFSVLPERWSANLRGGHLLVPVTPLGGFKGVMVCESGPGREFEAQDAESVKDILAIMRMGISHALYLEDLEKQAKNDGLTGLLNRKTFQGQLTSVLSRLDGRYPCVVAMLDIDHFKKINDIHGHPAGDEVLRKVSSVIRKTVRKVDMAGRYGGEEFVLYLHDTDEAHAFQVAERLRMMIRQTRFVHNGKEIGVTASLGIACYPAHGGGSEELLKHADVALYASKQAGRDRTTVYLKQ